MLRVRVENEVEGNGKDHNVRFRIQLINKVKKFKYFNGKLCKKTGKLWSV